MSLTCILVDDEPKALTSLSYELQAFTDRVQIVAQFTNPKEAQAFLESQSVDVVFLDVNMPDMDGFSFLEAFPQRNFEVVFTTAHSDHAVDAIKKEAIGYLVKPIDAEDLDKVVDRLERRIGQDPFADKLEAAIDRLNGIGMGPKKIKLTLDKKIVFIDPNEIVYCESDGNYCKIILEDENKDLFLTQKLKQVSELLPADLFYRAHNSYLINLRKVKEFHKPDGYILMDNDAKIPVSRQKRSEVLERL